MPASSQDASTEARPARVGLVHMEWIEVAEQAGGDDEMRLCDGHRGAERVPDGNFVIRLTANAGHTLALRRPAERLAQLYQNSSYAGILFDPYRRVRESNEGCDKGQKLIWRLR